MKTADLFYVALLAVTLVLDCLLLWPIFLRWSAVNPDRARIRIWFIGMAGSWALTLGAMGLWRAHGRAWTALGLTAPEGWRWWASLGLVLALMMMQARSAVRVARSPCAKRPKLRNQLEKGNLAAFLPHTGMELAVFFAVSLTAGFCEEVTFRSYLIQVFQPWLSWWGAAALSAVVFAFAHAYQGSGGILRTGIVGVILTLVVAIFGSLSPALVLHASIDIGSGVVVWLILREDTIKRDEAVDVGESA